MDNTLGGGKYYDFYISPSASNNVSALSLVYSRFLLNFESRKMAWLGGPVVGKEGLEARNTSPVR